jgi:UrcA family protein
MNFAKLVSTCGVVLIAGVTVGAIASPAAAKPATAVVYAPDPDRISKRISHADLNLASEAGATTLNRRVRSAVTSVCNETVGSGAGSAMHAFHSCKSYAWVGAKPQIANAVQRARDIASTGHSSIAAAAITITLPK